MNRRKSRKKMTALLFLIAFTAVCVTVAVQFLKKEKESSTAAGEYNTELVGKGTVATGISESSTVEFGTAEQTFSVAEITEVSVSSDSSDGDTQSSQEASFDSGGSGMNAQEAAMQGGMMGMSSMSSSGSSESSEDATSLTVEEVYAATGQNMEEGDKILKITQDSIEEYRSQLEAAVETAKLQVSQEEINVESKKAEADYTYAMYIAEGEVAEETYHATITSLENAVSDLEEELEEAEEDGDEDEMEELEAELQIAQNNLSTQSIEAKQTYENAMTNYKYADQLYEIDTNGLEDDLNEAKDTLEEAEQNLADFEEQIGEGMVYSQYSGTVTEIAYAAGDTLVNDAAVAVFTDSENVTMTVLVSQEDISQIMVGDEASIELTAYEGEEFPGEVTSISTSASTGSSTVNYQVTVRFTGDISKIYSGMTGQATFAGKSVEDTLYITNRAVYQKDARSYVKILEEDGSISEIEIKTGFSNGSIVAVESGLEEGQTVIIESKVGT